MPSDPVTPILMKITSHLFLFHLSQVLFRFVYSTHKLNTIISDCINLRLFLHAIRLLRAWMNESVFNVLATSTWTSLLVIHVKSAQYIFKSDHFSLTVSGSRKFTPQRVNGGVSMHLSSSTYAIFCSPSVLCNM